MSDDKRESLIDFPCDFAIKAMGETSDDFDALVVSLIKKHIDFVADGAVSSKQSSGGKFTSVTVIVHVHDQVQLDTIYQELSAHELIKYVL